MPVIPAEICARHGDDDGGLKPLARNGAALAGAGREAGGELRAGVIIAGIILAGGGSRRMGGRDKSLIDLDARPLVDHVARRLGPQVAALAISANGDPQRFAWLDLPVLADPVAPDQGPLAGVLAGLRWAAALTPPAEKIVTAAVDAPFFPMDLVARLRSSVTDAGGVAFARSGGRDHPVFALLPVGLADQMEEDLRGGTERSVAAWIGKRGGTPVDFALPASGLDPFFNVNTPADLETAAEIAAGL